MSYWRLLYHIVWATKERRPLIRPDVEAPLYNAIVAKGTQLGALIYAVGGIEDHVHVVASVPPRVALSDFIGQLKGNGAHFANHALALPESFGWQAEYGVLSLDHKQLDKIVRYVKNQRQHHTERSQIAVLERVMKEGETEREQAADGRNQPA